MNKYVCKLTKQEILTVLAEELNRINTKYEQYYDNSFVAGQYKEIENILKLIPIYTEEKGD